MDYALSHPSASSSATPDLADINEVPRSRTHQYRKVMKPLLERKRRARINQCLDSLKDLMVDALQSEGENVSKLEKADVLDLTVNYLKKLKREQRLKFDNNDSNVDAATSFRAGFAHCATEVGRFMTGVNEVQDKMVGVSLMSHLHRSARNLQVPPPQPQLPPQAAQMSPLRLALPQQATMALPVKPEPVERLLQTAAPHRLPLQQLPNLALKQEAKAPLTPPTSDGGYGSGRESVSPRLHSPNSDTPLNFCKREENNAADEPVWRPF